MTATPPAVTVSLLTRMLREAFEGPPGPWTYFTDTSPGTGVFGTLGGLSAAAASREGGPGHTTIAGHVHHLTSSVPLAPRGCRGGARRRQAARRLDRHLSGHHGRDQCHRVRLSVRHLPAVPCRRHHLPRRVGPRDRRALRQAPQRSLAGDLRVGHGARALSERLRVAHAAVPAAAGPDRRGTAAEGATLFGDAAHRTSPVRLAGAGRGQGVPHRAGRHDVTSEESCPHSMINPRLRPVATASARFAAASFS